MSYVAVFPTHVGVDRTACPRRPRPRRFPHARGGGPLGLYETIEEAAFSPRTWGWTARRVLRASADHVFPTHVGVDRSPAVH